MPLGNNQIISRLDRLIETCHDAELGFRMAANAVEDEHLRILFNNYCQQRAQLAAELQTLQQKAAQWFGGKDKKSDK